MIAQFIFYFLAAVGIWTIAATYLFAPVHDWYMRRRAKPPEPPRGWERGVLAKIEAMERNRSPPARGKA